MLLAEINLMLGNRLPRPVKDQESRTRRSGINGSNEYIAQPAIIQMRGRHRFCMEM